MTDRELIKEFRMNQKEIQEICDLISGEMQPVGHWLVDLTLKQKVLLCLKTLGSGTFQTTSTDFLEVTQPTVGKVVSQLVDAITAKAFKYIYMPRNREVAKIKNDVYMVAGFPGIVGCVHGSHIPLVAYQPR